MASVKIMDLKEAAIGAFGSVLFFFAVRQGEPLALDPMPAAIIGLVWIFLLYKSLEKKDHYTQHFITDLAVVVGVTAMMAVAFKMISMDQLFAFEYFGSAAWVAVWAFLRGSK